MGVPGLYKWFNESFSNLNSIPSSCDQLFLDGNFLLISCINQNKGEKQTKKDIIKKVEDIINVAKPTGAIFVAFDGPVPWKHAFNRSNFLYRLEEHLATHLFDKYQNTSIKIQCNSSFVPGEGERKIFDLLKTCHHGKRSVIYSGDADCILLALAESRVITILRDSSSKNNQQKFVFFDIKELKKLLFEKLKIHSSQKFQRTIDDFIILVMFFGNDFLPPLPALDIWNGGIDGLIEVYREVYSARKTFLSFEGRLNKQILKLFFEELCRKRSLGQARRNYNKVDKSVLYMKILYWTCTYFFKGINACTSRLVEYHWDIGPMPNDLLLAL